MTDGITLARNGTSITLSDGLELTRSAGRPKSELRPVPGEDVPKYIDKPRSAADVFELAGAFTTGTPEADARTLAEDILRAPLGRDALTLTFQNGVYELASYSVVPVGSRSARVSWGAGRTGWVRLDTIRLRRVQT